MQLGAYNIRIWFFCSSPKLLITRIGIEHCLNIIDCIHLRRIKSRACESGVFHTIFSNTCTYTKSQRNVQHLFYLSNLLHVVESKLSEQESALLDKVYSKYGTKLIGHYTAKGSTSSGFLKAQDVNVQKKGIYFWFRIEQKFLFFPRVLFFCIFITQDAISSTNGKLCANNENADKAKKSNSHFEIESTWSIKFYLDRLCKYAYLTPISKATDRPTDLGLMSLTDIRDKARAGLSFTCTTVAHLHNHTNNSPPLTLVYVFCKECSYLNVLPFHFVNIFEENTHFLKNVYFSKKLEALNENMNNHEVDSFNISWVFNAKPSSVITLTSSVDNRVVNTFVYDCPRCEKTLGKSVTLDYIYRFAFTLREQRREGAKLEPCLIENDVALKFANHIQPIEFCCLSDRMDSVTNTIFWKFSGRHNFKILANNQENNRFVTQKETLVYKIIDFLWCSYSASSYFSL